MSTAQQAITILGAGAETPVGRTFLSAAASVRAGISAYAEHPTLIDKRGEPIIVARADWLDDALPWHERVVSLGVGAARQAIESIRSGRSWRAMRLAARLALPEPGPGSPSAKQIAAAIIRDAALEEWPVEHVAGRHAAGIAAVAAARELLQAGRADLCLVVAADSHLDPSILERLDHRGRLHSIHNSWGFTPGEGAAALLLATPGAASGLGVRPLGMLGAASTAEEAATMGVQRVCIGQGLTSALREALVGAGPARVCHTWCDLNGDIYRPDEYGFAVCRLRERFEDPSEITTPADCWGDVGAASALMLATLPLAGWARTYVRGHTHLVWCSGAEHPMRGAMVLQRAGAAA